MHVLGCIHTLDITVNTSHTEACTSLPRVCTCDCAQENKHEVSKLLLNVGMCLFYNHISGTVATSIWQNLKRHCTASTYYNCSVLNVPYIRVRKAISQLHSLLGGVVRSTTHCLQLPLTSFFHQTTLWDPEVTSAGVLSFISKSHSDDITG